MIAPVGRELAVLVQRSETGLGGMVLRAAAGSRQPVSHVAALGVGEDGVFAGAIREDSGDFPVQRFFPGVLRLLRDTVVRRRGLHHGGTENTELKMNHSNYLRLLSIQRTMYAHVVLWQVTTSNGWFEIDGHLRIRRVLRASVVFSPAMAE